nr:MAG TPA: hypothetical protein [Caudoviricetes sp.]
MIALVIILPHFLISYLDYIISLLCTFVKYFLDIIFKYLVSQE